MEILIVIVCIAVIYFSLKYQKNVLSDAGLNNDFSPTSNRKINLTMDELANTKDTGREKFFIDEGYTPTREDIHNQNRIQLGRSMRHTIKFVDICQNEPTTESINKVIKYIDWYQNKFLKEGVSKEDIIRLTDEENLAVLKFNEICFQTVFPFREASEDDNLFKKDFRKG